MKYDNMVKKREAYRQIGRQIPRITLESYRQAFDIRYTHDSTAMEGNTFTLIETKLLLEDGISVGGKPLRETFEVVNHQKAYNYVKRRIVENVPLDETITKDIHEILMENIMPGGIYRSEDVYIRGAGHTPPTPNDMYRQVKEFYSDLTWKGNELNDIELAAWTHAEFVRIHPFTDGNGRTSRLLMNYQLMSKGWVPVSISTEHRLEYYETLDTYAVSGNLNSFVDLVAGLEERELDRLLEMVRDREEEELDEEMER